MRKLITILFLAFTCIAHGQYTPNSTYGIQYNRIKPSIVLHLPVLSDTNSLHTTDTSAQIGIYHGKIYFHSGYWQDITSGFFSSVRDSLITIINNNNDSLTTIINNHTDSLILTIINDSIATVASFNRNQDSIILTLSNGTRFAVKDSTGGGDSTGGISTLFFDQTLGGGFFNGTLDKTIGVDTSKVMGAIATQWDLSQLHLGTDTQPDSLASLTTFYVDSLSHAPEGSPSTGHSVLPWPTTTGGFVTHDNDPALWNGSSYGYTVPANGNTLTTLFRSALNDKDEIYQYDSAHDVWNLIAYPAMNRLNYQLAQLRIGTRFGYPFVIATRNTDRFKINASGNMFWDMFNHIPANPFVTIDPLTHQVLLDSFAPFHGAILDSDSIPVNDSGWIDLGTVSGGSPLHLGIEDNLGLQNRSVDMQGFDFTLSNNKQFSIQTPTGGQLTFDTSSYYVSDGSTWQFYGDKYGDAGNPVANIGNGNNIISIKNNRIEFSHSGTNTPSRLYVPFVSDSLNMTSPTRIAVWDNDTLKSAAYTGGGGGSGGISQLGSPAYGLTRTNDSTYIADTTVLASQTRLTNSLATKQDQLNGTGFVKASGTTISYDNSTYLTGNQSITLSGDVSGTGTTAITTTIGNNKVTNAMLRQSAGLSVIGNSTNSTANVADITAASDKTVLARNGTTIGFNTLDSTYITALHSEAYYNTKYLGNGISGTGSDNHVAIWSGASSQVYSDSLYYDRTNGRLGIRTTAPTNSLHVNGNIRGVFATGTAGTDSVLTVSGGVIKAISPTYYSTGSASPAGNYGNLQLNRNSAFATPASDSLSFSSATLNIKGAVSVVGSGITVFPPSDNQTSLVIKNAAANPMIQMGTFPGAPTYGGMWFGGGAPASSNYSFISNGAEVDFNAPTTLNLRISNNQSPNALQLTSSGILAGLKITTINGSTSTPPLVIQGGSVLTTTPASGYLESNGSNLFFTNSVPARNMIAQWGYVAKAVDYTATTGDYTIEVTATGKTITLPTAVGISGRVYTIKLTASGSGTVATTSSQTIDGSTTYSLSAQYKYVNVQSNGANWIIIGQN